MSNKIILTNISQIVTPQGSQLRKGADMGTLLVIEDGAIAIEDGIIICVGYQKDVESKFGPDYKRFDMSGKAILPGFVDSHTHFIFAGYRENEFALRLKGCSYMDIMRNGGGISNTVSATRKALLSGLIKLGKSRLDDMVKMGVTTVECKSGYGLDEFTEIMMLEALKELNKTNSIDIVSTYLGAHAIPEEYKDNIDGYINMMVKDVMPKVKSRGLAEFCDVFCEKGVFSISQSRHILNEALKMGFKLKLHADEIISTGGAELAVSLNAISADHLIKISDNGINALAASETVATLLPLTAFSLNENFAPARKMIDSECGVALASDYNPGSSFSCSIPMLIALACIKMNMTPEETITALTLNGAVALNRADSIGSIEVGKNADLIVLKYPSYKFLPYNVGMNCVERVMKNGQFINTQIQ